VIRRLEQISFSAKLLVAFILIVLLTSLAGYLFISGSVRRAFFDYAAGRSTQLDRVTLDLLRVLHARLGSMEALLEVLAQQEANLPVVLVDPEGLVAYAPELQQVQVGRRLSPELIAQGIPFGARDRRVWTFLPARFVAGIEMEGQYLDRSRRALWLAALTATIMSIFVSFLLIRSLTRPLRALDQAAKKIAAGSFDTRVDIGSADEIGRLATTFNDMSSSLAEAEDVKKRLIADISHELRTPLTTVRTTLEGLRDGLIEPSQETLSSLHDRVLLMTRLVQDLHQLALADAGRLSMHPEETSVEAVLDAILQTIGVQLDDEGIRLVRWIEPTLPSVMADPHRVEQILLNLFSNALRHTPSGGTITVRATASGEEIHVEICDSGPGLSEHDLRHVFDRFYQAETSRTEGTGAGLGLSIAKAWVEAHGGRIWAKNAALEGACFGFSLPRERRQPSIEERDARPS
jgi:signal transduction histidine kinase